MNSGVGLSRHDRKFEILKRLAQRTQDGSAPQWYTLREIAKQNGLRPTGHLRGILMELCAGRHLLRQDGEAKNHAHRDEFKLNMEAPVNADFASDWAAYQEEFWS